MLTNKSKGYKCATCDKAYIGKGGLARHYRLNPTHGTSEDLESDSCSNGSSGTSHASNTKKQTTLFVDFDADSTDKGMNSLLPLYGDFCKLILSSLNEQIGYFLVKDDPSSTTSVDGTKTHEWASVNRRCWDRLKKRGWNRQRKDMKPRLKEVGKTVSLIRFFVIHI